MTITVLHVEQPTVKFAGSVSADNARKDLWTQMSQKDPKVADLDVQLRISVPAETRYFGGGLEVGAVVHPNDFTHPAVKMGKGATLNENDPLKGKDDLYFGNLTIVQDTRCRMLAGNSNEN